MTQTEREAIVRRFIGAWNARDQKAIRSALHPDILCVGASYPAAHGIEETMALSAPFLAADEIDWQIQTCASAGTLVFVERIDRFRFGDRPWLVVSACGVFDIDDKGLIRRWFDYFDSKGLEEAMA